MLYSEMNNTKKYKNDITQSEQMSLSSSNQSGNQYVNFKINGRMFPTWVMANFKKYKLPPIIIKEGEDPCITSENKLELRKYQLFISKFMDYKSIYKDILLYHGMGSGKTASTINVYNMLYNYTPGWNVFILIKAALKNDPWMKNIKVWLSKSEYEFRFKNIIFVHYDSPFADKDFFNALKNVDSSKKNLFIVEEVHNFIRNVHGNISSQSGKRAQNIYEYIIRDKRDNPDTRVILLSATPAINNPFELGLMFNLLRPGIFPMSENQFNSLYVSNAIHKTLNKLNKNMFQRRIQGLVSYYAGAEANPGFFARKNIYYADVKMSEYQDDLYSYFEGVERAIEQKKKFSKSGSYKSYTRQACNFVFPHISQHVTGQDRPRPSKFRMTEREAIALSEGKDDKKLRAEKGSDTYLNVNQYVKAQELYIKSFDDYLYDKNKSDMAAKYTIKDDIDLFIKKYNKNFGEFVENEKKKSNLFMILHQCSAKMTNMLFNIMFSPGPVLVYSNYVLMEGLQIFSLYLKYIGFKSYLTRNGKEGLSYAEYHGGIKDRRDRTKALDAFNRVENKLGKYIKVMLVSPAGAEGLDLANVRQVHITEPYWNEVRIFQMTGRAIRMCSHKDLPMNERIVDVYRYKSIRKSKKWTADQFLEDLARSKSSLIHSFLNAIKEAAIDCQLFEAHNSRVNEYKCFQFAEPSLFDKHIGPAYKEDLNDDMRIDNGSSSALHTILKIKVMKIKAVMIKDNSDDPSYSTPEDYWFFSKSGVVYDYEYKFPIGKISTGIDGLPNKLNKDTYIIDYVIPIPMINQ
jgi:superfamily II DNA or RNA helicase